MGKLNVATLEKLLEMKENQEPFTLVEVLAEEAYQEGHIPGAHNIPTPHEMTVEQMEEEAGELDISKEDTVMVYCASYTCQASNRASELLLEAGYNNVIDFAGGKATWQAAGFGLE